MTFFTRLRLTRFIFPSGRHAPRHILPVAPRHIPDEVMLDIFHSCDVQTVVSCSLVSKHFRELVQQINHIHIEIPYTIAVRDYSEVDLDWLEGLEECLHHFSSIQSVDIKFLCYGPFPRGSEQVAGSALRWKYDSHGMFYLFIQECDRDDGDWSLCNVLDGHAVVAQGYGALYDSIVLNTENDIILWAFYIQSLVRILPNISQISATDSRGQGHMLLEGGMLNFFKEGAVREYAMIREKIWMSPVVKLPCSQHVMRQVFVRLKRPEENSDESVMVKFCDEEEYYQVATRMITEAAGFDDVNSEIKYQYM